MPIAQPLECFRLYLSPTAQLVDPEEERRRRVRRARIVRRNRIKRETAQGLPVRYPRVPRASNLALTLDNESSHEDWEEPSSPFRPTFGGNSDQSQQHERAVAQINQAAASIQPSISFTKPPAPLAEPQTPINPTAALTKPPASALIPSEQPKKSESVAPHVRARWQRALQQVVFKRHEEILTKDPNRKWRQERFGLLLYGHQEYERAAQHLSKAISLGSTSSLCWRRLAESYYYLWEQTSEWDVLWSCRTAFEQALTHVEVACSPLALFMYAQVLQLLGSYTASLTVCAMVLQTFPAFKQLREVKLRFVLLQRYQLFTSTSVDTPARGGSEVVAALGRETLLIKCIGYTQELLLDKAIIETSTASASNTAAIAPEIQLARTSIDVLFQQLYKLACKDPHLAAPSGVTWRSWKTRNETYTAFAEYFRARGEVILAADALSRSLELLEALPLESNSNGKAARPWEGISEDQRRKRIAVYVVLARNCYQCNQMEKAIRAMEAVIQLDPLHAEARASLTEWFPTKWQYRLDLEDASQVQIARVLRGTWGRNRASQRRTEAQLQAERKYLESPYRVGSRRRVVRLLRSKYAALFAAQDLAARRIQHGTRRYLYYARIRWTLAAQREKLLRDLVSTHLHLCLASDLALYPGLIQTVSICSEANSRRASIDTIAMFAVNWRSSYPRSLSAASFVKTAALFASR
ncbi:hypothetical protein BBJ28_00022780 [Nothophytophthora sp. Chile5]|nr:hypothetical protein BBJ28_00022780 [Nothophytophthora sp. Chile5]